MAIMQEDIIQKPNIVLGILAHVDAGKTTLSESILYRKKIVRKQGRVDHGNSFLDTDAMERERGITIFSKQAYFPLGAYRITLLDTPGHVDFSAEMERCLQVLDYAILIISAPDGLQSHTRTLWSLLKKYQIPVFVFVNKMDQTFEEQAEIMKWIKAGLEEACYDQSLYDLSDVETLEGIAMTDEEVMEAYLSCGKIDKTQLARLIFQKKIVPCFFGSALKNEGVASFLDSMGELLQCRLHREQFGGRIFKIERDEQGNRLSHMKITGGELAVKEELFHENWKTTAKINQIRLYQGDKYELLDIAREGDVVVVTGLNESSAGEGLGIEKWQSNPVLQPVLGYKLTWSSDMHVKNVLEKMHILEEENPELSISWDEDLEEIQVQLMGDVQIEVFRALVKQRFDLDIDFSMGDVLYRETISDVVEGVGHFEPLRHYAEVHLLLEPLPRGSGLVFAHDTKEDELALNWQRLIVTHLKERVHKGVLTGAPITDMKITVIAGRAHNKHTEGGDFRQACYRAVRQGLMQAKSVLLEPFFSFRIDVPAPSLGRVLADVERLFGKCDAPLVDAQNAVVTGKAPVSTMRNYARELLAFTKGFGKISLMYAGYDVCHNPEEVIAKKAYHPEHDLRNTPDSVFCAHGSGYIVPWNEVMQHMHVESPRKKKTDDFGADFQMRCMQAEQGRRKKSEATAFGQEDKQLMEIFERTYGPIKKQETEQNRRILASLTSRTMNEPEAAKGNQFTKKKTVKEHYLLVDGYNIIFAWEELKELAKDNIDGARGRLMDIMSEYQGIVGGYLILVFDAYKVKGNPGAVQHYHNIDVVYTKEAETADQYIEKTAHSMNHKAYDVTVATSDGLEQLIVRGQGCLVMSAAQLKSEVERARTNMRESYLNGQTSRDSAFLNVFQKLINEDMEEKAEDV